MAAFEHWTYFIMATDPLHVGTGGYRIGRVDNSILRDPATSIPKVPGSSISGVTRNYAIWTEKNPKEREAMLLCYDDETNNQKGGCGKCKICRVFGFSNKDRNLMGSTKFFDAQIVLFPIMTLMGPKWITTTTMLKDLLGISLENKPSPEKILTSFEIKNSKLNLGWIYLDTEYVEGITLDDTLKVYKNNLIIVDESIFSTLINMNLEVRTSVRIDPRTGSAKVGALFTYEAIPRTTLLAFDIIFEEFRAGNNSSISDVAESKTLVEGGMALLNVMGIGGMNTRGFGRVQKVYELNRQEEAA